jgi:hypothetical protein
MAGFTDLTALLAHLDPELHPEPWVYAVLPAGASLPPAAFAVVREDEGVTVVVPQAEAERLGLAGGFVAARVTLRVHSALEAVGMTAAFARVLAEAGISCNVVAGYHHDHLFVPWERRAEAVDLLRGLAGHAGRPSGS